MKRILAALCLVVFFLILANKPLYRLYYGAHHTELMRSLCAEHQLNPHLVAALIYTESKFDPRARSEVGARGLMQLMPETASELARREKLSSFEQSHLDQSEINLRLGIRYLGELKSQFSDETLVLAAYNAGPGQVNSWLEKKQGIAFPETRAYIRKIKKHQERFARLYPDW